MTDKIITFIESQKMYYFACPNCNCLCQVHVSDIKCGIFRHAVYKSNNEFIYPHTSKEECERLYNEKLVYGCTKPFKFNGKIVEICEYI